MKLLLSLLPVLSNFNGINCLKTFIKNDGYVYTLSNLKTEHFWSDAFLWENDLNINLYHINDLSQKIFYVYSQIAISLDYKYINEEKTAFNNKSDIFYMEIGKNVIDPTKILKLHVKDYSANWNKLDIQDNNYFSTSVFNQIQVQDLNNESYSLDVEASIDDKNWDPDGKFNFSINITNINDETPINIFSKEIQEQKLNSSNGLNVNGTSSNGNTINTSIDKAGNIKNGAYYFPFTSISNLFQMCNPKVINKYIIKFYLNFDLDTNTHYVHEKDKYVPKNNISQTFSFYNDYFPGNINQPATKGDSRIFSYFQDSNLEEQENPKNDSSIQNIKDDCISNKINQKFYFGKEANTSSYFTKYYYYDVLDHDHTASLLFRVFTIGCGTSSTAYSFSMHFHINSFQCQFKSDIWDNTVK